MEDTTAGCPDLLSGRGRSFLLGLFFVKGGKAVSRPLSEDTKYPPKGPPLLIPKFREHKDLGHCRSFPEEGLFYEKS